PGASFSSEVVRSNLKIKSGGEDPRPILFMVQGSGFRVQGWLTADSLDNAGCCCHLMAGATAGLICPGISKSIISYRHEVSSSDMTCPPGATKCHFQSRSVIPGSNGFPLSDFHMLAAGKPRYAVNTASRDNLQFEFTLRG
ncbi:MAG: hypothetical protein PVI58_06820, partial [Desulfobacterales bacterium]